MSLALMAIRIQFEHDVVSARQRTRQIAEALGFDPQQQTRLATAVSEIARNAFNYAGGGRAEISLDGSTAPQLLTIRIADEGAGIPNIGEILDGRYRSQSGMGLGIVGARRLVDQFKITAQPGKGTVVLMGKILPRNAPFVSGATLSRVLDKVMLQKPKTLLDEFREQNLELLRLLEELRNRQDELIALNRELEDTNRGVVALYAELDEKADHLRRADTMKSKFLSNMSHEFRTPLNSILALSRLLLDRIDGELTSEQDLQVHYIRRSAESLSELVNDLLDMAKVEAGKIEIRSSEFEISALFGALRGMLRPLLTGSSLNLVFEEPVGLPPLFSDEAKISQILRNFISNALKFTESGEVRVSSTYELGLDLVTVRVSDTGIGIEIEDRQTIFQEFTQLDSHLQSRVKGTGLGLPLARKFAELLGGDVAVESEIGVGSTFSLTIPRVFSPPQRAESVLPVHADPERVKTVLLVEDHYETRLAYERYLRFSPWRTVSARSAAEADAILRDLKPVAIVLDIGLHGGDSWNLLARIKSRPETSDVPVIVAATVDDRSKAIALGADEFVLKPVLGDALVKMLTRLVRRRKRVVLLVDDEAISRYLSKQLFAGSEVDFGEAADGAEAIGLARAMQPDLIILDLSMPTMNGFEAIEQFGADANLRQIPLIVSTSKVLSAQESTYLGLHAIAVLPKSQLMEPAVAELLAKALTAAELGDLIARGPA